MPSQSPTESRTERARIRILVVEDNKADVFLIREAIQATDLNAELVVLADGEKAVGFFEDLDVDDSGDCPALVILDINLPKKNGGEVLQRIRTSRRSAGALVLVVTSSDSTSDRDLMANLGVSGYFRKPSSYENFMKLSGIVKGLLSEKA